MAAIAREEPDQESLIDRAVQGDRAAIDALIERHLPGLRAFIRLRAGPVIRQRESESDLAQSVCRDVLEHLDRFQHREPNGFKRWLYSTALRKLVNRHEYWAAEKRSMKREQALADAGRGGSGPGLGELYRNFTTPSQHAMKREEIAHHLGKSEGAVRTQLSRALATLAEYVATPPARS